LTTEGRNILRNAGAPPGDESTTIGDNPMTEAPELESCEVACWQGYFASEFYAVSHRNGAVIARSKSFRWRRAAPPPDRPATRAAHDDLSAKLVALGWKAAGRLRDGPWYATYFERPLAGTRVAFEPAPQLPPAAAPEDVPELAAQPGPLERDAVVFPREVTLPAVISDDVAQSDAAVAGSEVSPPVAPTEPRKTGRSRGRWQLVVFATLLIAAAVAAWIVTGYPTSPWNSDRSTARPARPSAAQQRKATPHAVGKKQQPRPSRAVAPTVSTRLSISSADTGSWLEVRRGSATGAVLYSGVLSSGQTLHLSGKRLWARFGAASNLSIRANGRPVSLQGTLQGLFTPNGFHPG
jgi:uncharacterized protein DUF4115